MKKTKIICTLGPASESVETLKKMIQAGMNCMRMNFSHGTYENFDLLINNSRIAAKELGRNICLIQDLQGPKIRVGSLPKEGIKLKNHQRVILTTSQKEFDSKINQNNPQLIPIQYKNLPADVSEGDSILLDDGLIELKVTKTNKKNKIECAVQCKGILTSHKGINVPTASIKAPAMSEKDKKDLIFGLKYKFDYIALSFVKSEKDIISAKNLLSKYKSKAKIIAKIERPEAVKNLEKIIKKADAVMVARGDLAIEIGAEKVPIVQREIVKLAHIYGKPAIIATQILQSMVENPRPTRAEISDTATAIFEQADAVMLSNETSVGKYPVESVETLSKVAKTVEDELKFKHHLLPSRSDERDLPMMEAICYNGCKVARDINAGSIILLTRFGNTVKQTAKHRPFTEMITCTDNKSLLNELQLVWGINKVLFNDKIFVNGEINTNYIVNSLIKAKFLKTNQEIVIVHIQKQNYIIRTLAINV